MFDERFPLFLFAPDEGAGSEQPDPDPVDDIDDDVDDSSDESPAKGSSEYWRRRFKGLQRTLEKKNSQVRRLQDKLAEADERYEADTSELRGQLDDAVQERDTLSKSNSVMLKEKQQRDRRDTVASTIRSAQTEDGKAKYPRQMVELFEEGLMPGAENLEGDDLTTFLDKFATKLSRFNDAAVEDHLEGSTGDPPSGSARQPLTQSKDDLYQALLTHRNPDSKEYQQLETQYFELLAKD